MEPLSHSSAVVPFSCEINYISFKMFSNSSLYQNPAVLGFTPLLSFWWFLNCLCLVCHLFLSFCCWVIFFLPPSHPPPSWQHAPVLTLQARQCAYAKVDSCYCTFLHLPFLTGTASRPTEAALSVSLTVVMVHDDDGPQLNHSTTADVFPGRVSSQHLYKCPREP